MSFVPNLLSVLSVLTSPLQILAAQASSSPPVLVHRQPGADSDSGEPQAKRVKAEDETGTEAAPHHVISAQQPVIVAMTPQNHDIRKWNPGTQQMAAIVSPNCFYTDLTSADKAKTTPLRKGCRILFEKKKSRNLNSNAIIKHCSALQFLLAHSLTYYADSLFTTCSDKYVTTVFVDGADELLLSVAKEHSSYPCSFFPPQNQGLILYPSRQTSL